VPKRHEVDILLKAGHPKTEVACLSGVSLRSVKTHRGRRTCGASGNTVECPNHDHVPLNKISPRF
jgi:hypothetical protein